MRGAFCQRIANLCFKSVAGQQLRHTLSVPPHWRNDQDALFRIIFFHRKPISRSLYRRETWASPSKLLETPSRADRHECPAQARVSIHEWFSRGGHFVF